MNGRWLVRARRRSVPWWGVASAALAPLVLAAGWSIAARLQPRPYDAVTGTVSGLAGLGAADRWVMTLAFAAAGACEIAAGLALRPAAAAGRLILITAGAAGLLVAANPEPAGGGGSPRHMLIAAVGLTAMVAWPTAARQRVPSVPWGLRPHVSAAASVLLAAVLVWFAAELAGGGGLTGLAERVLGEMQTLWPPLVALSCPRRQRAHTAADATLRTATRDSAPGMPGHDGQPGWSRP